MLMALLQDFILATGILSMWMSNTATVVMMMPISLSVINLLVSKEKINKDKNYQNFATSMMLAIPYALIMLGINWFVLVKIWFPNNLANLSESRYIIDKEIKNLGPISREEKITLFIFISTALLWSFKSIVNKFLPIGNLTDESIALLSSFALFIIPIDLKKGEFLIDWKSAERLPWGILLLFGGGLSLAHGLEVTGVINWLGYKMNNLGSLPILYIIIIVSIYAVFLTEFMSNIALVTIFLPVLCSMAMAFKVDPLLLTIPVTISASCAFMLPMSTPPNAIVFASGHLQIKQMIKAGSTLNLIGIIIVVFFAYKIMPHIFKVNINSFPSWAIVN